MVVTELRTHEQPPPPPRSSATLGMGCETLFISTFLHLLFLPTRRHFPFEPLAGQRVEWVGVYGMVS
jgi:hypothetical protein